MPFSLLQKSIRPMKKKKKSPCLSKRQSQCFVALHVKGVLSTEAYALSFFSAYPKKKLKCCANNCKFVVSSALCTFETLKRRKKYAVNSMSMFV